MMAEILGFKMSANSTWDMQRIVPKWFFITGLVDPLEVTLGDWGIVRRTI